MGVCTLAGAHKSPFTLYYVYFIFEQLYVKLLFVMECEFMVVCSTPKIFFMLAILVLKFYAGAVVGR